MQKGLTKIALIPAFEPENELINLVIQLYDAHFKVILVDDGSGENYRRIFSTAKRFADVLVHETNMGKGKAIKTGLAYVKRHYPENTVVVTMDADGQHSVSDAVRVAEAAADETKSLVLGVRCFGRDVPKRSRFGNTVTRFVFRAVTGLGVSDTQTGLRAFGSEQIPFMLGVDGERYEYEMNVLLKYAKGKIPIIEVKIATIYFDNNEGSHFGTFKDSFRIYRSIFKLDKSKKSSVWTKLYSAVLTLFTVFVLLDTFVIPRAYVAEVETTKCESENTASTITSTEAAMDNSMASTTDSSSAGASAVVSENSYSDGDITITITEYREYDTSIYVADVTLTDAAYLKTAFAQAAYGKNITEKTSAIAAESNAILAINGDYYGAQNSGYVIRNGVIYRDTGSDSSKEDLVIYADGTFEIISEGSVSAEELLSYGAQQSLSFGPGLIEDGQISVTEDEEVGKAMTSNPRTAIGQISALHYLLVVSDGRTDESEGLSLSELAEFMKGLGVTTAYNLDGGGSSTMVFNGTVINKPTTNGSTIKERSVSDIVCIAY